MVEPAQSSSVGKLRIFTSSFKASQFGKTKICKDVTRPVYQGTYFVYRHLSSRCLASSKHIYIGTINILLFILTFLVWKGMWKETVIFNIVHVRSAQGTSPTWGVKHSYVTHFIK